MTKKERELRQENKALHKKIEHLLETISTQSYTEIKSDERINYLTKQVTVQSSIISRLEKVLRLHNEMEENSYEIRKLRSEIPLRKIGAVKNDGCCK